MRSVRIRFPVFVSLLLLSVWTVQIPADGADGVPSGAPAGADPLQNDAAVPETARSSSVSDGRDEIYAISSAFRDRIEATEKRNGQWSVRIDGKWFNWANGRMLPEETGGDWHRYISYWLYDYPLVLPEFVEPSEEEAARIAVVVEEIESVPLVRAETYMATLLESSTREDTEEQLERIVFLGYRFRGHRIIVEPLKRVEEEILRLAESEPEIGGFIDSLSTIECYNYRPIAGQQARSYHSYGIAVDLIPRSYGGKFTYWRWVRDIGIDDWWRTPYEDRWMIPDPIVRIFEHHGFIWGGKWLFFDTMHFEYRPELLLLSRLRQIGGR